MIAAETRRREPWVFGEPHTSRVRAAIRQRYQLLPYIYTAFYNASRTGLPIMRSARGCWRCCMASLSSLPSPLLPVTVLRPLWMEFPGASLLDVENEFLVGSDILVHPVVTPGQTRADVILPGSEVVYLSHLPFPATVHLSSLVCPSLPSLPPPPPLECGPTCLSNETTRAARSALLR